MRGRPAFGQHLLVAAMRKALRLIIILPVLFWGTAVSASNPDGSPDRVFHLLEQGRLGQAEDILSASAGEEDFPIALREKAYYFLGRGYLKALDFERAAQAFDRIRPEAGLGLRAAFLSRECRKAKDIPRDSPALAAFFSILLPGLGQLYLGRPTDAAWAAGTTLVPAAIAAAGYWAGSWLIGGPAGVVALAFFGGSVYNALNQAHRGNRKRLEKFRAELETRASALPGEP